MEKGGPVFEVVNTILVLVNGEGQPWCDTFCLFLGPRYTASNASTMPTNPTTQPKKTDAGGKPNQRTRTQSMPKKLDAGAGARSTRASLPSTAPMYCRTVKSHIIPWLPLSAKCYRIPAPVVPEVPTKTLLESSVKVFKLQSLLFIFQVCVQRGPGRRARTHVCAMFEPCLRRGASGFWHTSF